MMSKNTMKIETLKKIAQILDVPISYFFENQENKIKSSEDKMVGERNERIRPYLIIDEKKDY